MKTSAMIARTYLNIRKEMHSSDVVIPAALNGQKAGQAEISAFTDAAEGWTPAFAGATAQRTTPTDFETGDRTIKTAAMTMATAGVPA